MCIIALLPALLVLQDVFVSDVESGSIESHYMCLCGIYRVAQENLNSLHQYLQQSWFVGKS